jgi:subtilase family serine protease
MQQTTVTEKTSHPSAAVGTLAVVGFLALILVGIVLAIYAARYVPIAVSSLTGHSYESQQNSLTAVPSTTLSFDIATTSVAVSTTTYSVPTQTETTQTTSGTNYNYQPTQYQTYASQTYFPGSTQVQVPQSNYGLANLTVRITDIGYMDRNDRFVSDDSMSSDDELVVKILVTNNGTNSTGRWNIRTVVPTAPDKTFEFDQDEPSLAPGATLPLTLDLTRGRLDVGNNQEVKVTVDAQHDVDESNENDNSDTRDFDVRR